MASDIVVLDACVLFPASIRDTLLFTAAAGFFQMRWSWMILTEMKRNLVKTGRITEEQAQRLIDALQTIYPEAMITEEFASLIPSMTNDPKDRHVLAAAVATQATIIVTFNLRDFPRSALEPLGVSAQSPDTLLCALFRLFPEEMREVIVTQARHLRQPAKTYDQVLGTLSQHVPAFVAAMRALDQG